MTHVRVSGVRGLSCLYSSAQSFEYLNCWNAGHGVDGSGEGRNQRSDNEDIVLNGIAEDPSVSTKGIARQEDIGKSTVHSILKKRKFHPYYVSCVQTLEPRDYDARVNLCRQILSKVNEDAEFFDQILWSDKSSVKRGIP